jgi:adenylate cyclase
VFVAFGEVVAAVDCAIAIQRGTRLLNRGTTGALRLCYRIGVSFGTVLIDDELDLHGPAVNIAARLEALAEPGAVYLTGAAFDRLGDKGRPRCEALGSQRLRHITEPVRIYRVVGSEYLASPPACSAHDRLTTAVRAHGPSRAHW